MSRLSLKVLLLLAVLLVLAACGRRDADGPLENPYGLEVTCVGLRDSAMPFLVSPGELIIGQGEVVSEYQPLLTSNGQRAPVEIRLVDSSALGPGSVVALEQDEYDALEFKELPDGSNGLSLEGPSQWSLVLELTDTSTARIFVLDGIEYTLDGDRYFSDDRFELTLTDAC